MARPYPPVWGYRSRIDDANYTIRDIIKVSNVLLAETRSLTETAKHLDCSVVNVEDYHLTVDSCDKNPKDAPHTIRNICQSTVIT